MQLDQALALFLNTLQAEDSAQKTIQYYTYHLNKFIRWLPLAKRIVGAPQPTDITDFINAERARGMSKATVYGCYRALDGFFNWCAERDEVRRPSSPLKNRDGRRVITVKKPPRKTARRAEVQTVDALIDFVLPENWIQLRNRVAIRLLRDTGVRLNEAANARLRDLDLKNRVLTIPETKSREGRRVTFTPTLVEEINAYLQSRPHCPPKVAEFLFVSAFNADPAKGVRGKLTGTGLSLMLAKLCQRSGLPHTNPHAIRHMFGNKAPNGIRAECVSRLMGHYDPSFTPSVYAELLDETIKCEYDQHWK